MIYKGISSLGLIGILSLSVSCSQSGDVSKGSQSTGGRDAGSVQTSVAATFIDAPVDGLRWSVEKSNKSGLTSNGGQFNCERGELVRFEIGRKGEGIFLGEAPCGDKIFVTNLKNQSISDNVNIAQVLLTLSDYEQNEVSEIVKMTIPSSVANASIPSVNVSNFSSELDNLKNDFAELTGKTYVNSVTANSHLNSSIIRFRNTVELQRFNSLLVSEKPTSSNFNSPEDRNKEIQVYMKGTGVCSGLDIDFMMGIYKDGTNNYRAYSYMNQERVGSEGNFCQKLGRNEGQDFEGLCYGHEVDDQVLLGNNILLRGKIRDINAYLNSTSGPYNLDDAEELFEFFGSFYVESGRLKGKVTLERTLEIGGGTPSEYANLPEKCEYTINQANDARFNQYGEEDAPEIPRVLHGGWELDTSVNSTGLICNDYPGTIPGSPSFEINVTGSDIHVIENNVFTPGTWKTESYIYENNEAPGMLYFYQESVVGNFNLQFNYSYDYGSFGGYVHQGDPTKACNLFLRKKP